MKQTVGILLMAMALLVPMVATSYASEGYQAGVLKDILPGEDGSSPDNFVTINGLAYFTAWNGETRDLWQTDGTEEGTKLAVEFDDGASFARLFAYDEHIYFMSTHDGTGAELWRTDGTQTGTEMVMDINPGAASSLPDAFTIAGGYLYFTAEDADHGREWWYTDGTTTSILSDLNSGPPDGVSSDPDRTVFGNKMVFNCLFLPNGVEPWVISGTSVTELDVMDGSDGSYPDDFVSSGGGGFYFAADTAYAGREVYYSDGSLAGTHTVTDFPVEFVTPPEQLQNVDGNIIFVADKGSYGEELYMLDDEYVQGFINLKDIYNGSYSSYPQFYLNSGSHAFFVAEDEEHGEELWTTNGTEAGTHIVADVDPGYSSNSKPMGMFGSSLIFIADDDSTGDEFYVSRFPYTSAEKIIDLQPGYGSGAYDEPDAFIDMGGYALAEGGPDSSGDELVLIGFEQPPVAFDLLNPVPDEEFAASDTVEFLWEASNDPNPGQQVIYSIELMPESMAAIRADSLTDTTWSATELDTLFEANVNDTIEVDWTVTAVSGEDTVTSDTFAFSIVQQVSGVSLRDRSLPARFAVDQPYPNPFNPSVTVGVNLPEATMVRATVYDVLGRRVARIADSRMTAGRHTLSWNGQGLSAGTYFLRVETDAGDHAVCKLLLLK